MNKQWSIATAVLMVVFLSVIGATAQGPAPQGAGAAEAVKSSQSQHSYNPIKWVKKDSNAKTEKQKEKPKKVKDKKPAEKPAESPATLDGRVRPEKG